MNFEEMELAVRDARNKITVADRIVGQLCQMIVGRLRRGNVSPSTLTALKKELKDWNMHTSEWKQS